MLAVAWTFLKTPFGRDLGVGLAVILAIAGFALHERRVGSEPYRKANAEAEVHARVQAANAASISDTARKTLDQRRAQIITRYKTLIERVPQYVTPQDDAGCRIPGGFVELWNAPLDGAQLPSLAGPGGPASGGLHP